MSKPFAPAVKLPAVKPAHADFAAGKAVRADSLSANLAKFASLGLDTKSVPTVPKVPIAPKPTARVLPAVPAHTPSNAAPSRHTLTAFLTNFRVHAKGLAGPQALELLAEMVGQGISIRVLYDAESRDKNAPELPRKGFNYMSGVTRARVMLAASPRGFDYDQPYNVYCNGLVLDVPSWNVLALPPPAITKVYRNKEIIAGLDSLDIIPVKDGTTVTLYYWNDAWRIASKNGIDVGKYQWAGTRTYTEAVNEIATQYVDDFWGALDRSISYTIGFRHHDYHPLRKDEQKMWLVHACNTAAMNCALPRLVLVNPELGISVQTPMTRPKMSNADLLAWLVDQNRTSFDTFVAGGEPHYGYLLINSSNSGFALLLESELLRKVKSMVYSVAEHGANIAPVRRHEFMALRAYMSAANRDDFLRLFPQFAPSYAIFKKWFAILAAHVYAGLNGDKPPAATGVVESRLAAIGEGFASHIEKSYGKLNPHREQARGIINDFMMDVNYANMYFQAFNPDVAA